MPGGESQWASCNKHLVLSFGQMLKVGQERQVVICKPLEKNFI
jgi:hypothetical protein